MAQNFLIKISSYQSDLSDTELTRDMYSEMRFWKCHCYASPFNWANFSMGKDVSHCPSASLEFGLAMSLSIFEYFFPFVIWRQSPQNYLHKLVWTWRTPSKKAVPISTAYFYEGSFHPSGPGEKWSGKNYSVIVGNFITMSYLLRDLF